MPAEAPAGLTTVAAQILPLDFAPNDPLSAYLLSAGGPVDLERLKLDSPALDALREAGVKLIAPLTGQGELIGLLVTLLIRTQRQKQRLLAFGLSDHYRQIFDLTQPDGGRETTGGHLAPRTDFPGRPLRRYGRPGGDAEGCGGPAAPVA